MDNPDIEAEDSDNEDYREDWTRTTDDKDSYANKQLRKNIGGLKWKNIDHYPVISTGTGPSVADKDRGGSILSVFEVGHQDGVKLADTALEREEYERKRRASTMGTQSKIEKIENYPQLQKEYLENRQGSVLSAFVKQQQHFDDALVLPEEPPQDRKKSNVGLEGIENYPTLSRKEREEKERARHGSILSAIDDHDHSGEEGAPVENPQSPRAANVKPARPVIENYPTNAHRRTTSTASGLEVPTAEIKTRHGIPVNIKDRRGSVLSLWTENSDDHEFNDDDKDSDKQSSRSSIGSKVESKKARALSGSSAGQDRRGSILSLWTPGKDKEGFDVIHHDDDDHHPAIEEE